MSESAGAEGTSSQTSTSAAAATAGSLAAEEPVDELLAANEGPKHSKKRKYPDPDFILERSGPTGKRGSYAIRFKVKAAAFTRVLCADGKPVGKHGAAKVLGVDKKRIITWVKEEEKLKGLMKVMPKLSSAQTLHAGCVASTADVDQALEDYINKQRKEHFGCGNKEIMNKLLELKPDALGGLPATATPLEAEQFRVKFKNWYQRFRRRRGFNIRWRTSVGQNISSSSASTNTLLMAAACKAGDDNNPRETASNPVLSQLLSTDHKMVSTGTGNNSSNNSSNGGSSGGSSSSSSSATTGRPPPENTPSTPSGSGSGSRGQERGPSTVELPDEENRLRTTCDSCTVSKIKCDGGHPCRRCQRRKSECVYSEKKRCGPKRRRSSREESGDDSDAACGVGGWGSSGVGGARDGEDGPSRHRSMHKVLTSREQQFLAKFYGSVNKFIPLTNLTVLRDAMNPLRLDVVAGIAATETEKNVHHARKAVLLGCVGVGAVFCGDAESASAYMAQAQIHLKDCFDALLPEVVSCYLIMVVYHLHFLDHSKVFRYIGFAQQAYRELVSSKQHVDARLRDSVGMLSTFLHVACNSDIRVEEIDVRAEVVPESGTSHLSRILAIFSHVLLMLYRRFELNSEMETSSQKPPSSMESLGAMADEADKRLSMMEDPGSFALIVLKTLHGYFLLLKGKEQEVLDSVALPVARALAADTSVLCFPLCWHMCQCMRIFLRRMGLHAVASSMDQVMDPLKKHLSFASTQCGVAVNVMSVYAGKGAATAPAEAATGGGVFSTSSTDGSGGREEESKPTESAPERHRRRGESDAAQAFPPPASPAAMAAAAAEAAANSQAMEVATSASTSAESQAMDVAASAAALAKRYPQSRQGHESYSGRGLAGRRQPGLGGNVEGREGNLGGVGRGSAGIRIMRNAPIGTVGQAAGSPSRAGDAGATNVERVSRNGSMYVSSSAPSPAPVPARSLSSSSSVSLVYMNAQSQHGNLFDLDGSAHALEPGGNEVRNPPPVPVCGFDSRGEMMRGGGGGGGGGRYGAGTGNTTNRGVFEGGTRADSGGSSPPDAGLSPGDGHRDKGDGGECAINSGIFESM